MIRIFRTGPHAHRTPLSYPALAPLWEGALEEVDHPGAADLYVFAHSLDVEAAPAELVQDWRRRRRPVVILSEEPFWDTVWGRRPLARHRVLETPSGAVPVVQLNHGTSGIYRFDRIPYYLLTNHRFAAAYGARFARNAALSGADWAKRFAARPAALTFMFERRPEPFHALRWPEAGLIGLCSWRTELAEHCTWPGVERLGQSWGAGGSRFELDNWHLDKIVRLDGHARMIGAIENTHQADYITEKLFDAFACGAWPVYFAARSHRVHGLDLPQAAWINLYGLSPARGAARLREFAPGAEDFDAYAAAQGALAARFGDPGAWVAERARLRAAVLGELQAVLDSHPAAPEPAELPV